MMGVAVGVEDGGVHGGPIDLGGCLFALSC